MVTAGCHFNMSIGLGAAYLFKDLKVQISKDKYHNSNSIDLTCSD
jgi:hypothetical protein